MIKKYLRHILCIIAAGMTCGLTCNGQNLRSRAVIDTHSVTIQKVDAIADEEIHSPTGQDTIYAISKKEQHGWILPHIEINKTDIDKYSAVHRFTHKNAAGRWCKIDVIDGYGKPRKGQYWPKIVKSSDTLSEAWKDVAFAATHIELIADVSGEKVIQQRYFNDKGELIYTLSLTPIGSKGNEFIGSYKDQYGLPAEIRKDGGYSYGTLVYIQRDIWGNDSVIQYLDSKGYVRPNSDGVYKEVFVYDERGNTIKNMSMNYDDHMIIDKVGNCGVEYTYDADNNLTGSTYMDDRWQPMALPSHDGEISKRYYYDAYGRKTESVCTDADGKPMENNIGTHKIVMEYNHHGDVVNHTGFNLDGELSPLWDGGPCRIVSRYNDYGYMTEESYYGPDGRYYQELARVVTDYNEDGTIAIEKTYANINGDTILAYTKSDRLLRYSDGSGSITTFDDSGRTTHRIYHDADGNPNSEYRYPIDEWNYGVSTALPEYVQYNILGDTVDIHTEYDSARQGKHIEITSADGLRKLHKFYHADGRLEKTYSESTTEDGNYVQTDVNAFGVPSRCGGADTNRFFKAKGVKSSSGSYNNFFGIDEYGEAEYIDISDLGIYCHKVIMPDGTAIAMDEDTHQITDFTDFRNKAPKYFSIEVTDTMAYNLGIRDNDIILGWNGTRFNPYLNDVEFKRQGAVTTVTDAMISKSLTLFRIDSRTLKPEICTVDLPEGNIADLGFTMHCIYRTKRQVERMDSTLASYMTPLSDKFKGTVTQRVIVMTPYDFRSENNNNYSTQIGRPAVLVGAQIPEYPSIKWIQGDDIAGLKSVWNVRNDNNEKFSEMPPLRLYYTTDGETIGHTDMTESTVGCYFGEIDIDEPTYNRLQPAFSQLVAQDLPEENVKYNAIKKLTEEEKQRLYERAMIYYKTTFDHVSFPILQSLAKTDFKPAFYELAISYINGYGTEVDLKKGLKWGLKAHEETGYAYPLLSAANKYIENGKHREAAKIINHVDSSSYHYDRSRMYLGDIALLTGDTIRAAGCYYDALLDFHSLSINNEVKELTDRILKLPDCDSNKDSIYTIAESFFMKDSGTDKKKAFLLFCDLAERGYSNAMAYATKCLADGVGTDKNLEEAEHYAGMCLENGFDGGYYHLGIYYMNKRDYNKAISCFEKVDGTNRFLGGYYAGKIYLDPKYFANNKGKAAAQFKRALNCNGILPKRESAIRWIIDNLEQMADSPSLRDDCLAGLFFAGIAYFNIGDYEQSLRLFGKVLGKDPEFQNKYAHIGRMYYRAVHECGKAESEEYKDFLRNHIMVLRVPEDIDKQSPLAGYYGKAIPVVSINDWDISKTGDNAYNHWDDNGNTFVIKTGDNSFQRIEDSALDSFYLRFSKSTPGETESLNETFRLWRDNAKL